MSLIQKAITRLDWFHTHTTGGGSCVSQPTCFW